MLRPSHGVADGCSFLATGGIGEGFCGFEKDVLGNAALTFD